MALTRWRTTRITGWRLGLWMMAMLLARPGLGQARGPVAGNDYSGAWAQVPDILEQVNPPSFPNRDYLVTDYGAVADGTTDAGPAIRKAIADCTKAGGGRVVVPGGRFLVQGPIHLEDNVNLHLARDARVVFSKNPRHYLPVVLTRWECTRIYNYSPFVYAFKKTNVALTGPGVLDGQARDTWANWNRKAGDDKEATRTMNNKAVPLDERRFGDGHYLRPSMVQFYECRNILIEDVALEDAPFWCIHPVFCENVTIRRMRFTSLNPNNDGIDVDSCINVHIHDVIFDNHDDNIAIKSGRDREGRELARPSRNIVIHDCIFNSYTGIAFGSEMSGGVYNVFAENCEARSQVKRAVYLKSNQDRGGEIAHIRVRHMKFLDSREQMIALGTDYGGSRYNHVPHFHDVRIEDLSATGPCKIGLYIKGLPAQPVENIVLKDINIDKANRIRQVEHGDKICMQNLRINGELQEPACDNLPPDVYAGPDQATVPGKAIHLSPSISDDRTPPGKMSYRWSVTGGDPSKVVFDHARQPEATAEFAAPGRYVLKLTANDGDRDGYHTLKVTVTAAVE